MRRIPLGHSALLSIRAVTVLDHIACTYDGAFECILVKTRQGKHLAFQESSELILDPQYCIGSGTKRENGCWACGEPDGMTVDAGLGSVNGR